ncbi:MAG: hypothetical protein AAGD07_23060, partial [Planctomycetota bacterium]
MGSLVSITGLQASKRAKRSLCVVLQASILLAAGCDRAGAPQATAPNPEKQEPPVQVLVSDPPEVVEVIASLDAKTREDGRGLIIEIDFRGTSVSNEELIDLHQLPALRSLLLLDTAVDDAGLKHIGKISTLENLDLRECAVSDQGIESLSTLQKLKAIKLSGKDGDCTVGDPAMETLAGLSNLKVIGLDFLWVGDEGIDAIRPLKNLQELYLAETTVGNEAIAMMADFPNLKKLRLARNGIDGEGAEHLAKLKLLEELDLSECAQLDDAAMQPIGTMLPLTKLNLWRVNVTDAGI